MSAFTPWYCYLGLVWHLDEATERYGRELSGAVAAAVVQSVIAFIYPAVSDPAPFMPISSHP